MQPERPNEIPGVRKSSIVNFQTKQYYIPSIIGSEYTAAVDNSVYHAGLHPNAHMFFEEIREKN